MKKSKLFLATGAIALAIAAVFATKANKKFTSVATGEANNGTYAFRVTGAINFTTKSGGLRVYVQLITEGISGTVVPSTRIPLVTAGYSHDHPIYFKL